MIHQLALSALVLLGSPVLAGETVVPLDAFEDGGVVLTSDENVVGSEGPSSALGGFRAFTFSNSFNDGTLTLDEDAGTLALDTTGLGQTTLGYGVRLSPGGTSLQGGITTAINADLSEYEIIRFHILRNTAANRGVEFRVSFLTDNSPNGVLISSRTVDSPNGFEGVFDIELATLTGDANFADIDFITIGVVNQFVDQDWTIGPIELVDTDPPLCPGDCDGSGTIDFNDLVAMLFLFGEDLPECDTDGSGVVNFNDLVTALFAFGPCE